MVKTTITAHAGCMNTPMDSLEAIRVGIAAGADICEVDVNRLPDGTPVLKHNDVTSDDTGLVLLEAVFRLVQNESVQLNLDMKDFGATPAVCELATRYGVTHRVFFTGIGEQDARQLKEIGCPVGYFLNYDFEPEAELAPEELDRVTRAALDAGCRGVNTDYYNLTAGIIDRFHRAGLQVSAWTVDDEETMASLIAMCVDNITTNFPDKLKGML